MTSLLDHPLISQRYFFPRTGDFPDPFWIECEGARLACSFHEIDPTAKRWFIFMVMEKLLMIGREILLTWS